MNYRYIYMVIINRAKEEQKVGLRPKTSCYRKYFPNQYFEFHHILPKSLFLNWKNRKSNIVPLTAREHFFCHQLLIKIYPTNQMFYALHAFIVRPNCNMTNYRITSREYQRLKEKFSVLRKNTPSPMKGKHLSIETIEKIKQTKKN